MTRSTTVLFAVFFLLFSTVCRADCFDEAASYQGVNPDILRAIRIVENEPGNPHAVNRNTNGSADLGLMQVNTIHVPELNKYGVHKRDLFNGCKNIYVAAWLLRKSMKRHGNTWAAVGGYHSETPNERAQYANKVKRALKLLMSSREHRQFKVAASKPPIALLMASN